MKGFPYFPQNSDNPQESYEYQSLESALSRLNVSNPPPHSSAVGGGGYSLGSELRYPYNENDEILGDLGFDDWWVGSANGLPSSSQRLPPDITPKWSMKPLNNMSVADLGGKIAALAKDEYGSRFLQNAMGAESVNVDTVDMIFSEVLEHVAHLTIHDYGNYVIQRLVEVCSDNQRTQILLMLTKNPFVFITLCLHARGTRSVQKLMKNIRTEQQISLFVRALSSGVVDLSTNNTGQHVMEYCLKNFSQEHNKYLLNVVLANCLTIAKDKIGCCVLQQCVDYTYGETRAHLIAGIIVNTSVLAKDRYGNYVLQHLLGLRIPQLTTNLLRKLEGNYFSLSFSKYGSNVVEKCLRESGQEQSAKIILELCRNPDLSELLVHPFGNYVFQTALLVSKGFIQTYLLNLVHQNIPVLLHNPYGKRVLSLLDRIMQRM